MLEQIEMFELPEYHRYEMERHGRRIVGWIIAYDKSSAWSGAWYAKEEKAARFASYVRDKNT